MSVNWTSASNDLDAFLTDPNCGSILHGLFGTLNTSARRTVLVRANSASAKPETFTYRASAGSYGIWILNNGPATESGTLEVGVTP